LLKSFKRPDGSIFYIDNCFNPPGVGLVVSGICRGDDIKKDSSIFIGPFGKDFIECRIKGFHNNIKQSVDVMSDHCRGAIAIAPLKKNDVKRSQLRKGTVLLTSLSMVKNVCYHFRAIVTFFSKSVTIKSGYSPVIHLGNIRQTARIIVNPEENNGNTTIGFNGKSNNFPIVTFKFISNAEYIEPYSVFVIVSGEVHGFGMVLSITNLEDDTDAKPDYYKVRHNK
jgi:GTPase